MLPGQGKATLYRSNNLPARVTVRFPINQPQRSYDQRSRQNLELERQLGLQRFAHEK